MQDRILLFYLIFKLSIKFKIIQTENPGMLSNKKQHKSHTQISPHKNQSNNKVFYSPYRDLSTTCFDLYPKSNKSGHQTHILKPAYSVELTNRQLTFEPQIHELPSSLYPNQEKYKISRQQQYERLIEDSRRKIRERIEAKLDRQNKIVESNCSFRPKITDFEKLIQSSIDLNNSSLTQTQKTDIFNKLYKQAELKTKLLQDKIKEKIKRENPKNSKQKNKSYEKILNRQKHRMDPLYLRIMEVLEQRLRLRKNLQNKVHQQSTFQPQINANTEKIIKAKAEKEDYKKNVIERLMKEHRKREQRLDALKLQYLEAQKQNLPFKPNINQYFESSQTEDLLSRLKNISSKCAHDDELYTFQPKINQLSELIIKHLRPEKQSHNDKLDRLVKQPIIKKNQNLLKIQEEIYKECIFNPEINDLSSMLDCKKPCTHKCSQPAQQSFSFKPKINENSRYMRCKSTENMKKEKKKQIFKYKSEKQYNEMKECTFRPKINSYRHQGLSSVIEVEGVQNYIERRVRMNREKEQQRNYQEQVFHLQRRYDNRFQKNI